MCMPLFSHGWGHFTPSTSRPFVYSFIYLADEGDDATNLSNDRKYSQFEISSAEWTQLELIRDVLKVCVCAIVMLLAD